MNPETQIEPAMSVRLLVAGLQAGRACASAESAAGPIGQENRGTEDGPPPKSHRHPKTSDRAVFRYRGKADAQALSGYWASG